MYFVVDSTSQDFQFAFRSCCHAYILNLFVVFESFTESNRIGFVLFSFFNLICSFEQTFSFQFIINKIMKGPSWYQELSDSQMNAMNLLESNLSNDIVLGKSKHTRKILRTLGLQPIPCDQILKKIIDLADENDLVFLWVLWQFSYKIENRTPDVFSLNERLILSSVCHLNIMATINALNAVLPAPSTQLKSNSSKVGAKGFNVDRSTGRLRSYLEKLPRPKPKQKRVYLPPKLPSSQLNPYRTTTHWEHSEHGSFITLHRECDANTIEMKRLCMQEIMNLYSDKEKRINKIWSNLIESSKKTILERDISYIAASPIVLDHINEKLEFERMMEFYVYKRSIKLSIDALVNNFEQLEYIKFLDQQTPGHSKTANNYAPLNKYDAIVMHCVYGSSNRDDKQLVIDLDAAAGHRIQTLKINEEITDANDLFLSIKNILKSELYLWTMRSKANGSNEDITPDFNHFNFASSRDLDELLRVSLSRLRVDPRLVLPIMPKAHEIPWLRDWIRCRYGFTYNAEYRMDALKLDRLQWSHFDRHFVKVNLPTPDDVYPRQVFSYNKKQCVRQRMKDVDTSYYSRFNIGYIDREQKLWSMLSPHLCTLSSLRKTFYAYMPSCEYNIFHK